jgi:hypothetical protein
LAPQKPRTWNEVLDNLGENLIRLGTSLSALADNPSTATDDAAFAQGMEGIASGFRLAFRQARSAMVSGEKVFLQLVRASTEELVASQATADPAEIGPAQTLVHEGVLVCQEMVTLLNEIEHGAQTDPGRTRQTFAPSLGQLAESTASAGWELRAVAHEYVAEVHLAETTGVTQKELVPASMGLLHDMTATARSLRGARKEWFRVGQRLASALSEVTAS